MASLSAFSNMSGPDDFDMDAELDALEELQGEGGLSYGEEDLPVEGEMSASSNVRKDGDRTSAQNSSTALPHVGTVASSCVPDSEDPLLDAMLDELNAAPEPAEPTVNGEESGLSRLLEGMDELLDFPPQRKRSRLVLPDPADRLPKKKANGGLLPEHKYYEMIDRIKSARAAANQNLTDAATRPAAAAVRRENLVYKRVPNFPFVSLRTTSGSEKVYVRLRDRQVPEDEGGASFQCRPTRLLPVSFQSLKKQAETLKDRQSKTGLSADGIRIPQAETQDRNWVEKYRPKGYVELLSEEGINRALLTWLVHWDKVVFGNDRRIKALAADSKKNDGESKEGKFGKYGMKRKRGFFTSELMSVPLDKDGRPESKVALLCGPPGLGKTTLAHVIARHAGYRVVEMNASDDRSVDHFARQLETSTQMKAVAMTQNDVAKPNCLIIDEIDGAPQPAINYLVSFLQGKEQRKGGKSGKKEAKLLNRPIVCICNDAYVPALRALKPMALVLNIPPTSSARLAQRLANISRQEEVVADLTVLLALCEKTSNDIRSCLSTLEFLQAKSGGSIKMSDVVSTGVGLKDTHRSMFGAWQEVLRIPKVKSTPFGGSKAIGKIEDKASDITTLTGRFYHAQNVAASFGDYDKLFSGLFENFLHLKFRDSHLEAVNQGLEWAGFSDILMAEVHHSQNYSLMPYAPFTAVAFHLLFATSTWKKLLYPAAQFEMNSRTQQLGGIARQILDGAIPADRRFLSPEILVQDVLPFVTCIIHPPRMRPVTVQLMSRKEKAELEHVIKTMLAFSLTYLQQRTPEGTYTYILDPNLESLTLFPGSESTERAFPYATKQLIAKEIEVEKMRREDRPLADSNSSGNSATAPKRTPLPSSLPNHQQSLQPKVVAEKPERIPRDFFGRPIVLPVVAPVAESALAGKNDKAFEPKKVWYHFKEGYNNAVRKTVRIHDLV